MNTRREHSPYYRILPDGRGVPYMKGYHQSKEHIRNKADARRGKSTPVEAVIPRMTTWLVARPFVLRGALPPEIADLTDLSYKQAQNAINRPRLLFKDENYAEAKMQRRKRADKVRAHRGERRLSDFERNSISFARGLIRTGLIKESLSSWNAVVNLFFKGDPSTVNSFAYALVLEAFYRARSAANSGHKEMIDNYIRLGFEINKDWFKSELLSADRRIVNEALTNNSSRYGYELGKITNSLVEYGEVGIPDLPLS